MSNVDLSNVGWLNTDELSMENAYKSFALQLAFGDVVKLNAGNTRFDCANEQFFRKSGEFDIGNLLLTLFPFANDPFVDEVGDGDADTGIKCELCTKDASSSLKKCI